MGDKKVWFVTGAGRGMGVDIAQAALAAGHGRFDGAAERRLVRRAADGDPAPAGGDEVALADLELRDAAEQPGAG